MQNNFAPNGLSVSAERRQRLKKHTAPPDSQMLVNETDRIAQESSLPDTERAFWTFFKLMDLSKYFRAYCYKPIVDLGFSLNEIDVLVSLTKHPEKNTVKGISETMHLSKGMISQAVESLRKRKYVTVDQNKKDRRSVLISLNALSTPILEKLQEVSLDFVRNIINGIPYEQLQEVYQVVSRVYTNKEHMKALAPSTDGNT
ncbi:MAG: winged helix-turn-helix transcriptional regulator [Ruminococcaceae bacterium]|nr:winged helix-turn-helix transcriptional regulator [Oscillospiraceae bacterium]